MPKKSATQNSKTSSAPLKRRASNRAKSNNGAAPESKTSRNHDHTETGPVIEIAPSLPPGLGRAVSQTARRMRSAQIIGGDHPDAYVVDLLVNFAVDHRSDTGAERIPCGEITGIDGITEEIQARFVPRYGPGYYRMTPRVNGKITAGKWVEHVGAPVHEGDFDPELDDEDIEYSPSDDPEIIRLRERLRYEVKMREAQSRNGNGHNPVYDKLLEHVLVERLNPVDPVEHVVATFEAVEKIKESVRPHRESPPAPAPQPQVDPKVSALKIIAENPSLTEIAKEVFGFGSKGEGDGDRWAEVAMKAVENGEASKIVNALVNLVGTGWQSLASAFTPKPVQPPAQQDQAPQQAVQPTQAAPQVTPAQSQALPETVQQSQPAPQGAQTQTEQGAMQMAPVDALVYSLIQLMEKQAPITDAQNIINIAIVRNPELGDSVDELLDLPVDQVMALLTAYHPPVAQMTHAKTWLESLMNALAGEGDEFTEKEIES